MVINSLVGSQPKFIMRLFLMRDFGYCKSLHYQQIHPGLRLYFLVVFCLFCWVFCLFFIFWVFFFRFVVGFGFLFVCFLSYQIPANSFYAICSMHLCICPFTFYIQNRKVSVYSSPYTTQATAHITHVIPAS